MLFFVTKISLKSKVAYFQLDKLCRELLLLDHLSGDLDAVNEMHRRQGRYSTTANVQKEQCGALTPASSKIPTVPLTPLSNIHNDFLIRQML